MVEIDHFWKLNVVKKEKQILLADTSLKNMFWCAFVVSTVFCYDTSVSNDVGE